MIWALWMLVAAQGGEWRPLFDRLPDAADGWRLEQGVLHAVPAHPAFTSDLYSPRPHRSFELEVEYRVSPGGNSGLRYLPLPGHVAGTPNLAFACLTAAAALSFLLRRRRWAVAAAGISCLSLFAGGYYYLRRHPLALEFQVLDNERHRDGKRGPLYRAGALYGLSPAGESPSRPAGEWNEARVVVCGSRIEHWLNGRLVTSVDMAAPAHASARSGFYTQNLYWIFSRSEWSRLGWERPSLVGLQHHGEEVWFRSARIRELACESPPADSTLR